MPVKKAKSRRVTS